VFPPVFSSGGGWAPAPCQPVACQSSAPITCGRSVARIEDAIDQLVADHPLRPVFVVPGTTMASAGLDLARTVLRRAERRLVAYRQSGRDSNPHVLAYLNRASDLLYVLARHAAGDLEEPASHE
jgi:cob(I)alamin adenosyltransferase